MNLKTFLLEVVKQIRAGAASAGCIPNPRVDMEIFLKPNGSIASLRDDVCGCVHVTVLMLSNAPHEPRGANENKP